MYLSDFDVLVHLIALHILVYYCIVLYCTVNVLLLSFNAHPTPISETNYILDRNFVNSFKIDNSSQFLNKL